MVSIQIPLFEEVDSPEWVPDDWETPSGVARHMASLLTTQDYNVLEPACGTGQILQAICDSSFPNDVLGIELQQNRYEKARRFNDVAAHFSVIKHNFLVKIPMGDKPVFDVVIANPPFSLGMEFIERSLTLLNRDNPNARLIYLLPATFFQSQERGRKLQTLDCRIYQRHSLIGRVAYLKNGVPQKGRQCEDCIFDIRPGKFGNSAPEAFVEVS